MPRASKNELSEAQIQRQILDWLAARGILAFRMQSGATMSSYGGKTRMVRYGVPGMADVLAFGEVYDPGPNVIWPTPFWIEVKGHKGKQSDLQKSFQSQVEDHGHVYLLAYSLDDVIKALR